MAVPIPINFRVASIPADHPGNVQELLNALGDSLGTTFVPQANYILGQMGGVLPTTNVGPWANNNEWWFWSASAGSYVRSSDGVPVGIMTYWGGEGAPDNWLVCDGSEVSRTDFNALFQVIQTTWGAGDNLTTFNLPPGGVFFVNDSSFHARNVVPLTKQGPGGFRTGLGMQGGAQVAALLTAQNMPALTVKVNFAWTGIDATGGAGAVSNLYPASQTALTAFGYQVLDGNGTPLNVQAQTQFAIMPPFAAANCIIKYQ